MRYTHIDVYLTLEYLLEWNAERWSWTWADLRCEKDVSRTCSLWLRWEMIPVSTPMWLQWRVGSFHLLHSQHVVTNIRKYVYIGMTGTFVRGDDCTRKHRWFLLTSDINASTRSNSNYRIVWSGKQFIINWCPMVQNEPMECFAGKLLKVSYVLLEAVFFKLFLPYCLFSLYFFGLQNAARSFL